MKARLQIAEARTPDGSRMALLRHDRDFIITVDGLELMHSRRHESEMELARLGCGHLAGRRAPVVLIGGLGMGFTLRRTLDRLGPDARVVVSELVGAVVEWNREFLGALNGRPLDDPRVRIETGDVFGLISRATRRFDAILLDVDNGPVAVTDSGNRRLYGREGIRACRSALAESGRLAVWSAEPSRRFEQLLAQSGFRVSRFRVPADRGSRSASCIVWVAAT